MSSRHSLRPRERCPNCGKRRAFHPAGAGDLYCDGNCPLTYEHQTIHLCPICKVERADWEGVGSHLPTCPNCGSDADPVPDDALLVQFNIETPKLPPGYWLIFSGTVWELMTGYDERVAWFDALDKEPIEIAAWGHFRQATQREE